MKMIPYSVEAIWRGALQDMRTRRTTFFFFTGLIAPVVFWLMHGMLVRFEPSELIRSFVPTIVLLMLAIASTVSLRAARRRTPRTAHIQRLAALIHRIYFSVFILGLGTYSLTVALDFVRDYSNLPTWVEPALLASYFASASAGLAWAPSSLPRSAEEDAQAAARGVRWLPRVMAFQSAMIGIGVFLGDWLMHDDVAWGDLLVIGLAVLLAVLMVTFSIVVMYRFLVLAFHPIPPVVREEFNISVP